MADEHQSLPALNFDLYMIYAHSTPDYGLGFEQKLPWDRKLPTDMAHFKLMTTYTSNPIKINAVLMGRKTYDSLPVTCCPLSERINVVVTKSANKKALLMETDLLFFVNSYLEAFDLLNRLHEIGRLEKAFAIGGASCLDFVASNYLEQCRAIYVTQVMHKFKADVFLPEKLRDPRHTHMLVNSPSSFFQNGITYLMYSYHNRKLLAAAASENLEKREKK